MLSCNSSNIVSIILIDASDWVDNLPISPATTANPLPLSPALAASIVAFSDKSFVSCTISDIRLLASLILPAFTCVILILSKIELNEFSFFKVISSN